MYCKVTWKHVRGYCSFCLRTNGVANRNPTLMVRLGNRDRTDPGNRGRQNFLPLTEGAAVLRVDNYESHDRNFFAQEHYHIEERCLRQ